MTAEIVKCDDWGSIVEIDVLDSNGVALSCDCPETKLGFFEETPPEEWL